jgi:hypothetical protein
LPRGGVTAANFFISCKGVITNTSRPRTGRFIRYESFPSSRQRSRDAARSDLKAGAEPLREDDRPTS